MLSRRVLVTLVLTFFCFGSSDDLVASRAQATEITGTPLIGTWSDGSQALFSANGDHGAKLAFRCGSGSIPGPIHIDACGHFDVPGTYTLEVHQTPNPSQFPPIGPSDVHYIGWVVSNTLYMVVTQPKGRPGNQSFDGLTRIANQPAAVPASLCP
jgi:hypothetical protein